MPLLDSGSQTTSLTFTVNLSNPQAATISQSQATGTIAPSDAKRQVLRGQRRNLIARRRPTRTYKYQASGTAQAPYGLSLNDLDPRGVASNAAGTTQWVVDANKNVYVYSPGGALLGSWSAGGLSSSAQLTGIATNGTDIWLVDSNADKVFKYTGAASRLSGSQNAASSFNLVSGKNGDTNPQDLVTDGTSFWVVDGTALKVFKYTLSGSSLGSWAIDAANKHPTGITIDPTNVSNIWIVDNGTDKVYQYTAAASRTSGSQNAAATFALAAGNTNPQGIADPPPEVLFLNAPASPATNSPASISQDAASSSKAPAALPTWNGTQALESISGGATGHLTSETFLELISDSAGSVQASDHFFAVDGPMIPSGDSSDASFGDTGILLAALRVASADSDPHAAEWSDGALVAGESQALSEATDTFFALLGDDVGGGE